MMYGVWSPGIDFTKSIFPLLEHLHVEVDDLRWGVGYG